MGKKNNKTKLQISFWVTLFAGITFGFFTWTSWNKLTEFLGDSNLVWAISGIIVLLAIILGYFSFKNLTNRFT